MERLALSTFCFMTGTISSSELLSLASVASAVCVCVCVHVCAMEEKGWKRSHGSVSYIIHIKRNNSIN